MIQWNLQMIYVVQIIILVILEILNQEEVQAVYHHIISLITEMIEMI